MAKRPKPTKDPKPIDTVHRYRSAKSGRFVKTSYAKKNPGTTVREARKWRKR